ncbi:MAG TPA: prepilin-type N-terminal cleavage/methylation domain-containing protein [bacterium]|nr:prepilin-type N-terminal cleavage/methylation domain-containing protein [bacterium]
MTAAITILRQQERGATLIEALVAMTVLGIIATAVFGLFITGQTAVRSAQTMEQASLLAQQRLERIKVDATCNVIPRSETRSPIGGENAPGYTWATEAVEQAPGLHFVTVTVFWRDAGRDRQVDLATYIRTEGGTR